MSDRRLESEMTMQEEISSSGSDIESNPDQGLMMRINDQICPTGSQMDSHTTCQNDIVKVWKIIKNRLKALFNAERIIFE